ncbi:MAG TPA: SDR family oxidoreductase [Isosphaeraceae bacterium]|nr:SDR family oxidoreductase [Isosphaeraceae bacterium]
MTRTTRDRLLIGALAGAGVAWGARQLLRFARRITLDDRVVIITGASTGHGLMVARYAARHGAHLVLAAREAENLYAAEVEMIHQGARSVLAVPTDVADREQCQYLVDLTVERHGRVDVLVNNAGIIQVGPMETMTIQDFEDALATNFWGALYCTLAAVPHMRQRRFGRIANVVSVGGKLPAPHLLPYTASKFALTGLTQALRVELAKDGILITGIYPNLMRTGGHVHAWVKGDRQAEYTLFALSDTLPVISTSAEHVARMLWRAVCNGDPEVVVGWPAAAAATVHALSPSWTLEGLALINRLLPAPTGSGGPLRGEDVQGRLPELLSQRIPVPARPSVNPRG